MFCLNFYCIALWIHATQSAVLFCPSCGVLWSIGSICGPDIAASLIILCQKRVLIMGYNPHWLLLLLTLSLYISLNHLT